MTLHYTNYSAGHPWYYKLGGPTPKPKQILADVKESDYQGYMRDDIAAASHKTEPQRSEALRNIRGKVLTDFRSDLSQYRKLACELRQQRKQGTDMEERPICSDIHTSMSLKYCHLYNDLAHLKYLDELLAFQGDLFGF